MNVWNITGNLGKDCRIGNAGGTAVVNFSVAVKSGWGDKSQTIWVDCALWGKQAESRISEYLLKGQQVAVSGEMGAREHEGKTYITMRVGNIDLIGGRSEDQQAQPAHPSHPSQPQPRPQQFGGDGQGGFATPAGQQPAQQQQAPAIDYDDGIPF